MENIFPWQTRVTLLQAFDAAALVLTVDDIFELVIYMSPSFSRVLKA